MFNPTQHTVTATAQSQHSHSTVTAHANAVQPSDVTPAPARLNPTSTLPNRPNRRIVDKVTGASICNATMDMPRGTAVSADGESLWVIVGNTTVAKFDVTTLCKTAHPAPVMTLPKAELAQPVALSVAPTTGRVFLAWPLIFG